MLRMPIPTSAASISALANHWAIVPPPYPALYACVCQCTPAPVKSLRSWPRYSASDCRPEPYSLNTSPHPSRADPSGRYGCGKLGSSAVVQSETRTLDAANACRSIRSEYPGSWAAMTSASNVLNHSDWTPVVQELTSSLFTPYAIAVFTGAPTSTLARNEANQF